jgi:tRNA threonylcarbamoyladenosine biosynthesis protein TsaE
VPLYHFDFYRIESVDGLDGIGFDDYVAGGICIAEWCEKLGDNLPEGTITVNFTKCGETKRKIEIIFPDTEVFQNVDLGL